MYLVVRYGHTQRPGKARHTVLSRPDGRSIIDTIRLNIDRAVATLSILLAFCPSLHSSNIPAILVQSIPRPERPPRWAQEWQRFFIGQEWSLWIIQPYQMLSKLLLGQMTPRRQRHGSTATRRRERGSQPARFQRAPGGMMVLIRRIRGGKLTRGEIKSF